MHFSLTVIFVAFLVKRIEGVDACWLHSTEVSRFLQAFHWQVKGESKLLCVKPRENTTPKESNTICRGKRNWKTKRHSFATL